VRTVVCIGAPKHLAVASRNVTTVTCPGPLLHDQAGHRDRSLRQHFTTQLLDTFQEGRVGNFA
jgi:hypothetical protein